MKNRRIPARFEPKRSTVAVALALTLGTIGADAFAFGFGEPEITSALGQPLHMRVALQPDPSVDLSPQCLHLLGDPRDPLPTLTSARLTIEEKGAARFLHIDSINVIDEPILRVVVDAGCVQHVRREFTVLLDPPVAQAAAPAPAGGYAPVLAASLSATGATNVAPPNSTIATELYAGKTLDLGVARVHGRYGEPLAMEIPITGSAAAELDNGSVRVAQILASDGTPLPNPLQTSLSRSDSNTLLQLVTGDAIAEPALRVVVEVGTANASVRREYGVLLDLPAPTPQPTVAATEAPVAAPAVPSQLANAETAPAPGAAEAKAETPPAEAPAQVKPAKHKHVHRTPKLPSPAAIADAPLAAPAAVASTPNAAPEAKAPEKAAAPAEALKGADHIQLTAPVDDAAAKRFAEMDRRVQELTQEIVKLRNDLAVQKQREADLIAEGSRPGGSWIVAIAGGIAVVVGGLMMWTRRRSDSSTWNPGSWENATQFGSPGRETVGPQPGDTRLPAAASVAAANPAPAAATPQSAAGASKRPAARTAGRAGNTVSGADPITISPLTTPIEVTEVLGNEPSIEQLYTLFYDIGGNTVPGKPPQASGEVPPVAKSKPEGLDFNLGIPDSVQSPRAARAQGAMKLNATNPAGSVTLPAPSKDGVPPAPSFSYTGNALPGRAPEPGKSDAATGAGPLTEIPRDGDFPKTQPGLDLDLSTQPGIVTRFGPQTEMPRDADAKVATPAATPAAAAGLDLDLSTSVGAGTEIGPLTEIPRDLDEPATQVALDLNLNTNAGPPPGGDTPERESDPFAITTIPGGKS